MEAVRNEESKAWHLIGSRGCGAEPDGKFVEGNWAEIRDRVDARVRERDGIAEVHSTSKFTTVESAHPPGLAFEAYIPGREEGEQVNLRVNITDVADEDVETAEAVLATYTDEKEMYELEGGGSPVACCE